MGAGRFLWERAFFRDSPAGNPWPVEIIFYEIYNVHDTSRQDKIHGDHLGSFASRIW
jgi:hypothetical protein